jgi:hypothetical protein
MKEITAVVAAVNDRRLPRVAAAVPAAGGVSRFIEIGPPELAGLVPALSKDL